MGEKQIELPVYHEKRLYWMKREFEEWNWFYVTCLIYDSDKIFTTRGGYLFIMCNYAI